MMLGLNSNPAPAPTSINTTGTYTLKRRPELCDVFLRIAHESGDPADAMGQVTQATEQVASFLRQLTARPAPSAANHQHRPSLDVPGSAHSHSTSPARSGSGRFSLSRFSISGPSSSGSNDETKSSLGPSSASAYAERVKTSAHTDWHSDSEDPDVDDTPPVTPNPERPVTTWSMERVHTQSWTEYRDGVPEEQRARRHRAETTMKATFHDFTALSEFTTWVTASKYISFDTLTWRLSRRTERSLASRARQGALRDAISKARDYASVLNAATAVDRSLAIADVSDSDARGDHSVPYHAVNAQFDRAGGGAGGPRLNFDPEKVAVDVTVNVKFVLE
ncbi:hypothetical protein Q8F55_001549 [Vanrija albida]|uniref:DUF541 domain-containing protein n=1 Tax=Vanrija albida TaxID=181172 RepID=A0ABR3QH02_9TREE